jgi:methionyl-tRNA synthetase
MAANYCGGRVPERHQPQGDEAQGDEVFACYERLDFAGALAEVWRLVGSTNRAIVESEPWELARDPARRQELEKLLYTCLERVRVAAVFVWPVMPSAAGRVFRMLGLPERDPEASDLRFGVLEPGTRLGRIEPLFPRREKAAAGSVTSSKKEKPVSDTPPVPPASAAPSSDRIDISDFSRVELRVAQVKAAEKIAGSKRLLRLEVDLGSEVRQVVAGIAESYEPEALLGKKVALVANLKPAKLMGVESNGMVLAASPDGRAVLCTFDADVPVGTRIK